MGTETADGLVASYLHQLALEAGTLPPDQRAELLDGIREHIAAARAAGDVDDDDSVREILTRLGTPREIVAAQREDGPPLVPVLVPSPGTGRELAAVLLLTVGGLVVPLVGWLVGVVLLWMSPLWTRGDKLLGTLVWPGGPMGVLLLLTLPASSCSTTRYVGSDGSMNVVSGACEGFTVSPGIGIPVSLLLLGAPVLVAVLLYRRAKRRAVEAAQAQAAEFTAWATGAR